MSIKLTKQMSHAQQQAYAQSKGFYVLHIAFNAVSAPTRRLPIVGSKEMMKMCRLTNRICQQCFQDTGEQMIWWITKGDDFSVRYMYAGNRLHSVNRLKEVMWLIWKTD